MGSAAGTCEIARLPEDLLSAALALTTPRDACRAAAVSRAFRDAAGSDAVWARFLPRDLPPIADGELSGPAPPSKKDRFLRLSDRRYPVLLADGQRIRPVPKNPLLVYGFKSMWLDRGSSSKCYMLLARGLHISWGDACYWRWMNLPDSRLGHRGSNLEWARPLASCCSHRSWRRMQSVIALYYKFTLLLLVVLACNLD